MKAVILAAGRGTRISRYLSGKPKSTVDIGGEPLIHYTVRLLKKYGVNEIALVLGYQHNAIKEALQDMNVTFYYNPFFDVTNSIASAWFAKEFINDDMIFLNGDVFMEENLLKDVVNKPLGDEPVLFSDETRKEEADYKLYYENNKLKLYGKELKGNQITGEYIGVARFSKSFSAKFTEQLEKMISDQQHGLWWENVLYQLSSDINVMVYDIEKQFWAEVDYVEDYERILKYTKEHMIKR